MKKIFSVLSLSIFLISCNGEGSSIGINSPQVKVSMDTSSQAIRIFKGLYSYDGKNRTFVDCDHPGIHLIENKSNQVDTLYKSILPNAYPGEAMYVELKAQPKTTDNSAFADVLVVKEFIKAEQKNQKNSCIRTDYWCLGTEPFWQVQISEKENLLDFYDPMQQKTTHFSYSKPELKNGITTYISQNNKTKEKIRVVIKQEHCNGAIDPYYNYSAQIELNGKTYSGCAVKP